MQRIIRLAVTSLAGNKGTDTRPAKEPEKMVRHRGREDSGIAGGGTRTLRREATARGEARRKVCHSRRQSPLRGSEETELEGGAGDSDAGRHERRQAEGDCKNYQATSLNGSIYT